jgi:hypothetical protein
MKGNKIILMVATIVIALGGQAFASVNVTATSPGSFEGVIDGSSPFQIDIYMDYIGASELVGGSFSFALTSPDGSIENVIHVDVGDDSEVPSIQYLNGFSTYFNLGIIHVNGNAYFDGALPDYINFTMIGFNGLPSALGPQGCIRLNLQAEYSTTGIDGQLCIDSVASAEGNNEDWDWLFDRFSPTTFNGTSGAVCWTISNLTLTDVHVINTEGLPLPTTFNLGQNYPNPFNPSTRFDFALPERAQVNITIYNSLGQTVKTLVDAEYSAGRYSVEWNGISNGESAATGVYFYRMNANNFQATKKLLLLK